MTLFPSATERQPPCLKALGLVLFIVTPGSLLVLPLVAWWMARRVQRAPQAAEGYRPTNTGLRFSINAVRPSV